VPGTFANCIPVWRVARRISDRRTPMTRPLPPLIDTPPRTTAVSTKRIAPSALSPRADWYWATQTRPARPDMAPARA
jgi:hypothetical protein